MRKRMMRKCIMVKKGEQKRKLSRKSLIETKIWGIFKKIAEIGENQ